MWDELYIFRMAVVKKETQTSELGLGGGGDKEQNFLQMEGEWGGVGMK